MQTQDSTPTEVSKFFAQHNLNLHISFYKEHNRLVWNEKVRINRDLERDDLNANRRKELESLKRAYETWYLKHMITNSFLMIYSHFEEWLGVLCRTSSAEIAHSKRSGLERFKERFEKEHSIKLSNGPRWGQLRESEKVRDILLHAGGNVSLARNGKQEIEELVRRKKDRFEIDNSRLVPKEAHLAKFVEEVANFTEWLADQVN